MTKENTAFNEDQQVILRVMNTLNSPRRWTKDQEQSGIRYCLVGAFKHVLGVPLGMDIPLEKDIDHPIHNHKAWKALRGVIDPERFFSPMEFNDDYSTTHRDVMDALAAALLKAGDTTKGTK